MTDEPIRGTVVTQSMVAVPEGWTLDNVSRCRSRSCGAHIAWCTNDESGKRAPFDLDGTSHFATCPEAGSFRRRKGGRR